MNDPVIRRLTLEDLDAAFALSSTAGWNQRLDDWRMLMTIAPAGSFAALAEGRIVGTSIGIDYGGFGWIAMMLVDPAYRGRGLGRRLLESAMNAIPADRPVRLDATPMGRPLYERYGFVDESRLTRFVADASARGAQSAATAGHLMPPDLDDLADDDREIFGGDRRAVLAWSLADAPAYARVVRGERREYCLGRCGRLFDQVGPVVALDDDGASTLVSSAVAAARDRAVVVDALDANSRFTDWLRAGGFRAERPLFRMRRPPAGHVTDADHRRLSGLREFAIFGPEFG